MENPELQIYARTGCVLCQSAEHSRVLEPLGGVGDALHSAQHDLGVEIVRDGAHVLALDGQLLVEERQVKLQLLVPCQSEDGARSSDNVKCISTC